MKIPVFKCDICGKTMEEDKDVIALDSMHFCEVCVRKRKSEITDYTKKMGGSADNEKFLAFVSRAHLVLTTAAIEVAIAEAKQEEEKKATSSSKTTSAGANSGAQHAAAGFAN